MDIRILLGEVDGKDIIDMGDIVEVFSKKGSILGRLNKSSSKELRVGTINIKVEEILSIRKVDFLKDLFKKNKDLGVI